MPLVIDRAKQNMDAEACSILFYNKETHKLEFEVVICRRRQHLRSIEKDRFARYGTGIAGWVAEHRKTLVINDAKSDPRFFREPMRPPGL